MTIQHCIIQASFKTFFFPLALFENMNINGSKVEKLLPNPLIENYTFLKAISVRFFAEQKLLLVEERPEIVKI